MNVKNSKETILNQALTIFGRLGFHKTTMADIASASKRGRRTIYMYFKNKEEVYEAVVEREINRVIDDIQEKLEHIPDPETKFAKYVELRIRSIIKLTKDFGALRQAFLNNYKWVEKIRQTLDVRELNMLVRLLDEANAKNLFSIENTDLSAKNIMMLLKGIEFILIKENNDDLTTKHIHNLQNILLNGLIVR